MKKIELFSLFMAVSIMFSACSGAKCGNSTTESNNPQACSNWTSEGRAYKQSTIECSGDCLLSLFANGSDFYVAVSSIFQNPQKYEIIKNGTETIYAPPNTIIDSTSGNDEGIWIVESEDTDEGYVEKLRLISYSGETLLTKNITDICNFEFPIDIVKCSSETVYLKSYSEIVSLNNSGEYIDKIDLKDMSSSLVIGSDDKVYLAYYTDEGIEVNSIVDKNVTPLFSIATTNARIFSGNEEFLFTVCDDKGLYGLNNKGAKTPIIIWSDCNITTSNVRGIVPLENSQFMLIDSMGTTLLSKANPSDMHNKTILTMAAIDDATSIKFTINDYNMSNSEYYIEVKDYSENGSYDKDTAITRLNTDIVSGNCPDLIQFSGISPFSYINRGYLVNMCELMDNDPDFSQEDIAILKQLKVNDGLYYLSGRFYIGTRAGLYEDFGDTDGWTLAHYLEFEKSNPEVDMLYSTTRPYFLEELCKRYSLKAIDWKNCSCDFYNDEFIQILDASNRIKEIPQPTSMEDIMNQTPQIVRLVQEKNIYTIIMSINDVYSIAAEEKEANTRLSIIGYPTADGSCGTDISIDRPIGIFSGSKNIDACWDFIKYMLTSFDVNAKGWLPVYTPYLQEKIDMALSGDLEPEFSITQEDADRFLDFLDSIEHVDIYDENVMNIIKEEASYLFAGVKTADEVAKLIQSRVSNYVAEQS